MIKIIPSRGNTKSIKSLKDGLQVLLNFRGVCSYCGKGVQINAPFVLKSNGDLYHAQCYKKLKED